MTIAEEVYESLTGQVLEEYRLPWVENAFGPGCLCDRNYTAMWDAYGRLRERLGAVEEDPDAEEMINRLLANQRELCLKMFAYGALWERNKPRP